MSEFNYIVAMYSDKVRITLELLTINHINKCERQYYSEEHDCYFFKIPVRYASYDKLFSIMNPHCINVISGTDFINDNFGPIDDSIVSDTPINTRKHLEALLEGIHYIYRYNLEELMLNYPEWQNTPIHKLKHQALLNRMILFLQKKMIKDYCKSR
jgi:hypothetical protein